ncbi:hypothetical protein KJS94_02790 [Flavihumibacter rivuli]|uniref:hypothetical protein n=1 Tax=Flavihumibacter rivuli TaxID=2838156 RepID=UPI001BDF26E0|nr:hypothetical protein [Flavihumibacter rivuli]ULQ57123.1 hypothetical protein KJS94_02790 [Flavihumibacter rivuli]
MDKALLDDIIEKNKAQPVGKGYIDIIVSRDNYKAFIIDLVANGFKITGVSWWEWHKENQEKQYGLGGPKSIFYEGWFFEIPVSVEDFSFSVDISKENIIAAILYKIETKVISFSNETVTFKESSWLVPAIWLDVPDDWRNKYST